MLREFRSGWDERVRGEDAFRQKDLAAPGRRCLLPRHMQRRDRLRSLTVGSRCFGKLDDQLFWPDFDSHDVSVNEAPVVNLPPTV